MEGEIDTEVLISLVEDRSLLWDKTCEQYKNKSLKLAAWREICCILKPGFMELNERERQHFGKLVPNKWSNIRDAFKRAAKKQKEAKRSEARAKPIRPYIYASQLKFLSKINEPGNTHDSSNTQEQEAASTSSAAPTPSMSTPKPLIPSAKKSKLDLDSKISKFLDLKLCRDTISSHEDDSPHLLFFKGILPSINTFNEDETLELQADILATIQRIRRKRRNNSNISDYASTTIITSSDYQNQYRSGYDDYPTASTTNNQNIKSPESPAYTDMSNSTQDSFDFSGI